MATSHFVMFMAKIHGSVKCLEIRYFGSAVSNSTAVKANVATAIPWDPKPLLN